MKSKCDALQCEVEEADRRLTHLKLDQINLKKQLKSKKEILIQTYPEAKQEGDQEEAIKQKLLAQKKELIEAIRAVSRVESLAMEAGGQYRSAKGWATYDTFFGGGILSDVAKYDKMDQAANTMQQMISASSTMYRELEDVNMVFRGSIARVDATTKVFDIAFDNIFTDWNVRSQISECIHKLDEYLTQLHDLTDKLESQLAVVEDQLKNIDLI